MENSETIAISQKNKVREYIRGYYKDKMIISVPSINRREFGVGFRKKIEARHISFETTDAFRSYLVTNTPMYVSYSVAYYEFPEARPIEKKKWLGADLIFDMDLSGGKYDIYTKFSQIHDEVVRLVKDFLVNDFGIDIGDITSVFSGSKGFHVHVRNDKFKSLGSEERREIVDYISGIGFSHTSFMTSEKIGRLQRISGPTPNDGGYPGRFARMTIKTLSENPKVILGNRYSKEKIDTMANQIIKGISRGNWSFIPGKNPIKTLEPVAKNIPITSIPLDASVSYDIKRLIRVPNSIHGGSGLIATVIRNDKLESFNPFIHARMPHMENWHVRFTEDIPKIRIDDITIGGFGKGDKVKLPDNEAIFYVLKGSATIL